MLKLLCKICATLTPSDIDIVEQMSNVATILSNILDMDLMSQQYLEPLKQVCHQETIRQ